MFKCCKDGKFRCERNYRDEDIMQIRRIAHGSVMGAGPNPCLSVRIVSFLADYSMNGRKIKDQKWRRCSRVVNMESLYVKKTVMMKT